MKNSASWTINVPMSHAARTMYTVLAALASPSGHVDVDDEALRSALGLMSGSRQPMSRSSLYRLRTELLDLGMISIENVYDSTPKVGGPRITFRNYRVAMTPPAHIDATHANLLGEVSR